MLLRSGHTQPRRRATVLRALAGAAAVTLLAAACGGGGGSGAASSGASGAATLVAYTGQSGDYQINFNPFSPSSIGGIGTIYEPLFFINKAQEGEPVPLLGTEYAWNEDGTQLDVTLREGVTWSDGEAFTADDVVFTFGLLKSTPAINNIGFDGDVTATDDTHVRFTFPAPAFVLGPGILTGVVVPEHLWADVDPTTFVNETPVGTGAYTLDDFKPQAFTYVANPDHWGGEPAVKGIRFVSLSGNTAGADAIANGTVDWQTGPVPDIQNVSTNFPDYDTLTASQNQMVLSTCSNAELGCTGPQTDPAVRHALYLAMDRTQLNALAFEQTASEISPTFALTSSQTAFITEALDEPVAPEKADPAGAGEVLEAAGWAKGSDGIYAKDGEPLRLTVEVVTGWTDYITALQTLTEQVRAAGIDLQVAQSSWNEWTEKKGQGSFQLAIDSLWQGPAPDPYYLYSYFFTSTNTAPVGEAAGNNYSRFSDPEVDAALDELQALPLDDAAARQPIFDRIQARVVEEMPYVPILTGGTTSEWNTARFTGWPTEDDMYAFPAVWSALDAAQIFKTLEPAQG
ncbi:ABC transporter substrate-binding protein [Cellulomonas endophytica]|uniref:ABC transporter substrate-binding protein n=1 Tax=Cellulomonas endophytica TaxID=2494735 RepID=UPI0010118EF6|nr:ABC transporter substrate-binding protein [Cellulomonas endophytica]